MLVVLHTSFLYFPGTDTIGWGIWLRRGVCTDPLPGYVTFKVTPLLKIIFFCLEHPWGGLESILRLACPLVSVLWNKNFE